MPRRPVAGEAAIDRAHLPRPDRHLHRSARRPASDVGRRPGGDRRGAGVRRSCRIVEVFRRPGRSFLMPPPSVPLGRDVVVDLSHESLMRCWTPADRPGRSRSGPRRPCTSGCRARPPGTPRAPPGCGTIPELELGLRWRRDNHPTAAWARRYGDTLRAGDAVPRSQRSAARSSPRRGAIGPPAPPGASPAAWPRSCCVVSAGDRLAVSGGAPRGRSRGEEPRAGDRSGRTTAGRQPTGTRRASAPTCRRWSSSGVSCSNGRSRSTPSSSRSSRTTRSSSPRWASRISGSARSAACSMPRRGGDGVSRLDCAARQAGARASAERRPSPGARQRVQLARRAAAAAPTPAATRRRRAYAQRADAAAGADARVPVGRGLPAGTGAHPLQPRHPVRQRRRTERRRVPLGRRRLPRSDPPARAAGQERRQPAGARRSWRAPTTTSAALLSQGAQDDAGLRAARPFYERAIGTHEDLTARDPRNREFKFELAKFSNNYAGAAARDRRVRAGEGTEHPRARPAGRAGAAGAVARHRAGRRAQPARPHICSPSGSPEAVGEYRQSLSLFQALAARRRRPARSDFHLRYGDLLANLVSLRRERPGATDDRVACCQMRCTAYVDFGLRDPGSAPGGAPNDAPAVLETLSR